MASSFYWGLAPPLRAFSRGTAEIAVWYLDPAGCTLRGAVAFLEASKVAGSCC